MNMTTKQLRKLIKEEILKEYVQGPTFDYDNLGNYKYVINNFNYDTLRSDLRKFKQSLGLPAHLMKHVNITVKANTLNNETVAKFKEFGNIKPKSKGSFKFTFR